MTGNSLTLLERRLASSIRVGNLYFLGRNVAEHLRQFSAPGLFHTEEQRPYHLTKGGSVSLLKFSDRYFALASLHQFSVDKYDFHQLCISNPARKTLVTPQAVVFPDGGDDHREDFDCVRLEYTEPVRQGLISESAWFDISNCCAAEPVSPALALLCIGYPGYRNSVDYDAATYAVAPNAVWGSHEASAMAGRASFVPLNKLDYEPNGMSGSPVFRIDVVEFDLVLTFAGMLTEATSKTFNYISFSRIMAAFFP